MEASKTSSTTLRNAFGPKSLIFTSLILISITESLRLLQQEL
ncbi:hypothetical protein RchiOBHm_Chr3g0465821 [Rosa chinensis]|uniref:Uncharacterized protein n=1 Tax=Rosa chinensis TaxID=74649 RepID=A0A2P6R9U6_ROSCH|nr:hypothetical protein RchiOBHm_Chr3g0465821 [Rosa chinensis]